MSNSKTVIEDTSYVKHHSLMLIFAVLSGVLLTLHGALWIVDASYEWTVGDLIQNILELSVVRLVDVLLLICTAIWLSFAIVLLVDYTILKNHGSGVQ